MIPWLILIKFGIYVLDTFFTVLIVDSGGWIWL
jgi:hypothetical protein